MALRRDVEVGITGEFCRPLEGCYARAISQIPQIACAEAVMAWRNGWNDVQEGKLGSEVIRNRNGLG